MRWPGIVSLMEKKRNELRVSMGQLEGKRLLRRHRVSLDDNIKI
jgi:hypothetical protein